MRDFITKNSNALHIQSVGLQSATMQAVKLQKKVDRIITSVNVMRVHVKGKQKNALLRTEPDDGDDNNKVIGFS